MKSENSKSRIRLQLRSSSEKKTGGSSTNTIAAIRAICRRVWPSVEAICLQDCRNSSGEMGNFRRAWKSESSPSHTISSADSRVFHRFIVEGQLAIVRSFTIR